MLILRASTIHPQLIRDLQCTEGLKAIVVKRDTTNINYDLNSFFVKLVESKPGISLNSDFDCYRFNIVESTSEIFDNMNIQVKILNGTVVGLTEEDLKIRKEKAKIKEEKERAKHEAYVQSCIDFYNNLSINAKFTPVYTIVSSGLTENSLGDGAYKNTVIHLRLDEDFSDGKRLNRKAGESLCKFKPRDKYVLGGFQECNFKTDEKPYYPKITCKSCLKILKNKGWLKEE